jgi:bacteriorhodopsin
MIGNTQEQEKGQYPDRQTTGSRRAALILLAMMLSGATVTLILRAIKMTQIAHGANATNTMVSLGFAVLIAAVDLIWLIYYRRVNPFAQQYTAGSDNQPIKHETIAQANSEKSQVHPKAGSKTKTLSRIHAIVAWLIYHTAALPFIFLADRARGISVHTYLLVQLALLIMGLIPIVSMIWLDQFMNQKLNRR